MSTQAKHTPSRQERLAARLRENLRRRKAQQRSMEAISQSGEEEKAAAREPDGQGKAVPPAHSALSNPDKPS